MRKGSNLSAQQELDNNLRQIQLLINSCLDITKQFRHPHKNTTKLKRQAGYTEISIDFDMNERAFIKSYAKNLSSGPKKFVLLLAYLAKGETGAAISLDAIKKLWNRTSSKSLLGMKFNRFFPATAKEHGLANPTKRGFYILDRSWKKALIDD